MYDVHLFNAGYFLYSDRWKSITFLERRAYGLLHWLQRILAIQNELKNDGESI